MNEHIHAPAHDDDHTHAPAWDEPSRDAEGRAVADLRIKSGVGEKPMLSELPAIIGARLDAAKTILAALNYLTDESDGHKHDGLDRWEWSHRAYLWLLNEEGAKPRPEPWFCTGCGQTDPSKRCLGCPL